MAALDELLTSLLPAARVVWPAAGFDAETPAPTVGWVRLMKARVPAFDALEPGDLAIVPASTLSLVAAEPGQARAIVDLCRGAAVAAILIVDGDDTARAAPAAPARGPRRAGAAAPSTAADPVTAAPSTAADPVAALERAVIDGGGPVLIRAPRADAAGLERAVIGYLVNRRAELDRQAGVLEADLEALALGGSGTSAMVGAIATFLGRPVALEDRRGEPIAVHAPSDLPEAAGAVTRYQAGGRGTDRGPRAGRAAAHRVPLPAPGGAAGSLALLGDRPVGELERIVTARIAGLMALELARDDAVRQARDAARRSDTLPADGPPWVVLLARQRYPDDEAPGTPPGRVPEGGPSPTTDPPPAAGPAQVRPDALERREAVRRDLRRLASARRMTLRGDAESLELRLVLAGDAADPDATELASRVAALLGRTVAVSRPFDAARGRPAAEAEARATLEAVEALDAPPPIARASRLGAYRLLGSLHHLPDGPRHARTLLEPILGGRPDVRREHLATLRAVLDHAGTAEAAIALGVHRNTVSYRMRRIEAITGWRLDDPDLRVALAMAVRLVPID